MQPLRFATDPRWVEVALDDFDSLLCDQAHAEKKAAASAMALVSGYPDRSELVRRCARLAQEELRHFVQIHELIVGRGRALGPDRPDRYARALLAHVRTGRTTRLVDRLLVFGLIEARSCERLELLAGAIEQPELQRFYATLAKSESGHHRLFVELAQGVAETTDVAERLDALLDIEADIVQALPLEARIH